MSERRVSIIGTKRSGKTTMLGLLDLATSERAEGDRSFTATIDEKTSSVLDIADRMCLGYFPPRTPTGGIYEADFVFHKKSRLGTRRLRLPTVETAGEDLAKLIEDRSKGLYNVDPRKKYDAWALFQYVLRSIGFIFIAPCTEIRGLERFDVDPVDQLRYNADTNIARLLTTIIEYKERTKTPPIEGLAVLFTKSDLVMSHLQSEGYDIFHQDEQLREKNTRRFMARFMRNTNRMLNHYEFTEHTVFIPSWVDLAYDGKGQAIMNDDGSPRIQVKSNGLPQCSGYFYDILINWICSTFMR